MLLPLHLFNANEIKQLIHINIMTTSSNDSELGAIHWPDEAAAVISDVKKHVQQIFISSTLPTNAFEIFINLETIECKQYTIRLSSDGFQIAGNRFDVIDDTNGFPYETPYALLSAISPGFIFSFGDDLSKALLNLEQKQSE